jgi:dCTP deaminase
MDPAGIEPASLGPKPRRISSTPWIHLIHTHHKILSLVPVIYCTMILSSAEIQRQREAGDLVIRPYSAESQQPASYDLRAAERTVLKKGECTLVHSTEWVELPAHIAATLRCRSSLGRMGVLLGGGFVDPGFRGQLTLCLVNMGGVDVTLEKGDRIVQIIMHAVMEGAQLYEGRYQDSSGVVHAR